MVCFLPLCCLVYSAAQSGTAEQYPSGQNLSPLLIWDVSDMEPFTLLTTVGSSRSYPGEHCTQHVPSISSRGTATFISTHLTHTEQMTTVWYMRSLFWIWSSSTEAFARSRVQQGLESNFSINSQQASVRAKSSGPTGLMTVSLWDSVGPTGLSQQQRPSRAWPPCVGKG